MQVQAFRQICSNTFVVLPYQSYISDKLVHSFLDISISDDMLITKCENRLNIFCYKSYLSKIPVFSSFICDLMHVKSHASFKIKNRIFIEAYELN